MVKATLLPLYAREGPGTHCRGGWVGPTARLHECRKSRTSPAFNLRTVQPVTCSYTDYAIPAHGRQTNHSSIPGRNKKFSLLWCIQIYFRDHPANPMRTAGLLPGELKRSERETDHSPHKWSGLRVELYLHFLIRLHRVQRTPRSNLMIATEPATWHHIRKELIPQGSPVSCL